MGTVVIHAGTGKAGTSSIKGWLATSSQALNASGVRVLVARVERDDSRRERIVVEANRSGHANSNAAILHAYESEGAERQALLESLFSQLDGAATRHPVVVISSEVFDPFFWKGDEIFLRELESLANRHRVRVAYYVRPQHTALEAAWRQWGFRTGQRPSSFLLERSQFLHYFRTYLIAREHAPSASFEPRPFRRDLLDGGDPAVDFAQRFLEVGDAGEEVAATWSNRGLPLEVANALRLAPSGRFWSSVNDNSRFAAIKDAIGLVEAPESEQTIASRGLLLAYCHETFERDNRRLIETLGWDADTFVPAPEGDAPVAGPGLDAIDELWTPRASEVELAALYAALERALAAEAASHEQERALTAAELALADARAEWQALGASFEWRLSRRLRQATARLRRRSPPDDRSTVVARRLSQASGRVERAVPRADR